MITLEEVKKNEEVEALIQGAQKQLDGLGYTEHSHRHISIVSKRAGDILEKLGYDVEPKSDEIRADIVQTIKLGTEENLVKFCQGIQKGSPIDSNVIPYPSEMGGYEDKVIMAAGTFTEGSTIELSCDGPIREPFIAYMQGGLTYNYGKFGILKAIQEMKN